MEDKSVLKDCGFDDVRAKKYAEAVDTIDYVKQLQLLNEQRRIMLKEMHDAAGKVDCIDFLIAECKRKQEDKNL